MVEVKAGTAQTHRAEPECLTIGQCLARHGIDANSHLNLATMLPAEPEAAPI